MKTLLFVLDKTFPYGDAFSCRARNFTKLFSNCGYNVEIVAKSSQQTVCAELDGMKYHCNYITAPQNLFTLSGIGTAKPFIEAIEKVFLTSKVDAIFSASLPFVTPQIAEIARKKKIPYYVEHCEWYDPSIFKGKKYNPYYIEHVKLLNQKMKNVDGIIAISRYLEKHFLDMGMNVIRIPTILDLKFIEPRIDIINNSIINITFAGSLGKGKENLRPMIEAASKVNEHVERIHLHIFGANENQVKENIGNDAVLMEIAKTFSTFHGRIPQTEVEEKIRVADFSFIIRPKRQSSDAGFPTKLAESMAVGTPVIANDTGDIGMIINNGENGFLVHDSDELVQVLNSIVNMDIAKRTEMRKRARIKAEQVFDYRVYEEQLLDFLKETTKEQKRYGN